MTEAKVFHVALHCNFHLKLERRYREIVNKSWNGKILSSRIETTDFFDRLIYQAEGMTLPIQIAHDMHGYFYFTELLNCFVVSGLEVEAEYRGETKEYLAKLVSKEKKKYLLFQMMNGQDYHQIHLTKHDCRVIQQFLGKLMQQVRPKELIDRQLAAYC